MIHESKKSMSSLTFDNVIGPGDYDPAGYLSAPCAMRWIEQVGWMCAMAWSGASCVLGRVLATRLSTAPGASNRRLRAHARVVYGEADVVRVFATLTPVTDHGTHERIADGVLEYRVLGASQGHAAIRWQPVSEEDLALHAMASRLAVLQNSYRTERCYEWERDSKAQPTPEITIDESNSQ